MGRGERDGQVSAEMGTRRVGASESHGDEALDQLE